MTPVRLRVKELREAKDWTQRELAKAAKVRPGTIIQIENERTTRVDLAVLERLANALGVDPGFLVVRVPAKRGGK